MDYAVPDGTAIFLLLKYECFTIYLTERVRKEGRLLEHTDLLGGERHIQAFE